MTSPSQPAEKAVPNLRPALYATLYMLMVPAARKLGYALAIHGSMVRDMDVVAIPWTGAAVSEKELVDSLISEFKLYMISDADMDSERKHFGRRAYTLGWDAGMSIDLSITPRYTASDLQAAREQGCREGLEAAIRAVGDGYAGEPKENIQSLSPSSICRAALPKEEL